MKNIHSQLPNDLLYLYAKTGNKDIESLYLKFAESSFQQAKDFVTKNISKANINSKVASAIKSLIGIYDAMGNDFSIWNFTQVLLNNKEFSDDYPIIKLMAELYEEGKFIEILSPFAQIFSMSKIASVRDEQQQSKTPDISKKTVEKDLEQLNILYRGRLVQPDIYDDVGELIKKKKKETKEEKIIAAIQYCISEFSSELSSAALRIGNKQLADFITPDNLSNYRKIMVTIGVPTNWDNITEDAARTSKQIIKDIKKLSAFDVYDLIRTKGLYISDQIPENQMRNHFYQKIINIQGLIGDTKTKQDKIKIDTQKMLNKSYILYVSIVIFMLLREIK